MMIKETKPPCINKCCKDLKEDIKKQIEDGWKYGDLREGNFEHFMNQVFNE